MDSENTLDLQPLLKLLKQKKENEPLVSILLNQSLYFFHHVLIVKSEEVYRLLVIQKNRVLFDKNYETLKGARVAFAKYFRGNACGLLKKPRWGPFSSPEKKWMDDLQRVIS